MKALLYLDSSAALRVLFNEAGARIPLDGSAEIVTSRLTAVEVARAIERARLAGALDDRLTVQAQSAAQDLLSRCHLLNIDEEVFRLAAMPFGVAVRSLDALHVASAQRVALRLGRPITVWTHDERMRDAAMARSLFFAG